MTKRNKMKLTPIKNEHIIDAGKLIDNDGIPVDYLSSYYWVSLSIAREYPFTYLVQEAYKLATKDNEKQDFKFNDSYRTYIKGLGFTINYRKEGISFFNSLDISHFNGVGGKQYRSANPDDVRNGTILRLLTVKLNKWGNFSLVEDFEFKSDNYWQASGRFKPYLWLKTSRKGDSGKVFFVFGVHSNGYIYLQLNCLRSDYANKKLGALPDTKIRLFDEYLGRSEYSETRIQGNELSAYNWDRFIELGQDFIYQYAPLYDELERITSAEVPEKQVSLGNTLTQYPHPTKIKSKLSANRIFKGKKTDWAKKQTTSKRLGNAGEELVMVFEKQKLNSLKLFDEEEKVQKKLDGEGYDILSFDENKKELHIEVKTTFGDLEEPFFMSANEIAYYKVFPKNYLLYRLYNYNYELKIADFYIFSAEQLMKLDFNATNYEVSIK
jgi:hypothetical protein